MSANITLAAKKDRHSLRRRSYLNSRCRALHLARKTLYTVFLSRRVRFTFRKRMPRRISPIIQRNGANVDAYSVSNAAIPIYSAGCSMNTEFLRSFNGSPYFVAVVFGYDLAFR